MKAFTKSIVHAFALTCLVFLAACQTETTGDGEFDADSMTVGADTSSMMMEEAAVAMLEPTEGNDVRGTVNFTPESGGVRITADITGLEAGEHGIHIHEFGDCSAPDASSAGGHFAPQGSPHGAPDAAATQRHSGDFGNLEANDSGEAEYDRLDEVVSLSGANSIIGKAVVVHAGRDDLQTQPSGDSGARVACGVIQMEGAAGAMSDSMDTM